MSSVDPKWAKVNNWSAASCIALLSLLGFTCPAMLKKQHVASELQKIRSNCTWESCLTPTVSVSVVKDPILGILEMLSRTDPMFDAIKSFHTTLFSVHFRADEVFICSFILFVLEDVRSWQSSKS